MSCLESEQLLFRYLGPQISYCIYSLPLIETLNTHSMK